MGKDAHLPFVDVFGVCAERDGEQHCGHLAALRGELQLVCCHCGDVFTLVEDDEPAEHGEYGCPDGVRADLVALLRGME